jgi:hypothetical protein
MRCHSAGLGPVIRKLGAPIAQHWTVGGPAKRGGSRFGIRVENNG